MSLCVVCVFFGKYVLIGEFNYFLKKKNEVIFLVDKFWGNKVYIWYRLNFREIYVCKLYRKNGGFLDFSSVGGW